MNLIKRLLVFCLTIIVSANCSFINDLVNNPESFSYPKKINVTAKLISEVTKICVSNISKQPKVLQWYHYDYCHKYRCELKGGKYHIDVFGCKNLEPPREAIDCHTDNEHTQNERFPLCCPRMKCIVSIGGEKYIRTVGQPEEIFKDERWPWKTPVFTNEKKVNLTEMQTFDYENDREDNQTSISEAYLELAHRLITQAKAKSTTVPTRSETNLEHLRLPRHPGHFIDMINKKLFSHVKSFLRSQVDSVNKNIDYRRRNFKQKTNELIEDGLESIDSYKILD